MCGSAEKVSAPGGTKPTQSASKVFYPSEELMTTSLNATGTSLLQLHYAVFGSAPTLTQLNSYAGEYQALVTKGSSASAARTEMANKMFASEAGVGKYLPNLTSANYQAATLLKNMGITNAGIVAFVEKALDGTGGYGQYSLTAAATFLLDYVNNYKAGDLADSVWNAALLVGNSTIKGVTPPSAPTTPVPTFTVNTDSLMGTAADEMFVAAAGTWTTGDKVDGGTGTDTLKLALTGAAAAGTISGIEIVDITASPNPASIDMSGVAGVTQINNVSSANGASLTVNNVAAVVNSTITGGNSATTINYGTAVTAATATTDAATVTLAGVSAGSSFVTAGVETLTLNSTTAANTLTTLTDTGITKLVVTGDKALTITNAVGGTTIGSIDASALKAALTITAGAGAGGTNATGVTITGPTDAAATFSVTTDANKDTITTGLGKATVVAGAGSDTITIGGGDALVTPGDGNDSITLGAGVETIRFSTAAAATNVDTIMNFDAAKDVLAFNLGTATAAATATTAATTAAGVYGVLQTGSLSPTLATVAGTGTGTTHSFASVSPGSTVANTIPQTATVVALNGVYADGTAAGVVTALGATGTTGVTTTTGSRFLLVTYSVGNIAQVWSYLGDTTANTDIDTAELSLVASLSGVPMGGLSASNFAAYLASGTALAASTASTGQTINLTTPLNTVTGTANAAGQFFTGAADTVNVATGALPTTNASTTAGLTLVDATAGDGDVLNATVLAQDWNLGTVLTQIETVNLEMLVADGNGFAMTTVMPGTTTLNVTGSQNLTAVSGIVSGTAFGLGANYTGTLNLAQGSTLAAATLNLNGTSGTSAATSPTFTTTNTVTTLTINANATTTLNAAGSGVLFNATNANMAGAGNVTIFGSAADFAAGTLNASGATYTGALTLRPSSNAAMDFSDTSLVTGIRTIDLRDIAAYSNQITLAAANNSAAYGTGPVTVAFAPTSSSSLAALPITILGTATTDALTVSLGANATGVTGAITASGFETVTVSSAAASTVTTAIGNILMDDAAGSQSVTVTGAGNFTLGNVRADVVNTAGVTGTVSLTLTNSTSGGSVFTGGTGNTTVTGTGNADSISTGVGADTVDGGAGADLISTGAGNDTITGGTGADSINAGTGTNIINDAGDGADIITHNSASSTVAIANTDTGAVTLAASQTGATVTATAGARTVDASTSTAAVVLNGAAAGANIVTYTGGSGADTITGGAGADVLVGGAGADSITGGAGADQITVGAGADIVIFTAANIGLDTITDTGAPNGDLDIGDSSGDILRFSAFVTGGAATVADTTGAIAGAAAAGTTDAQIVTAASTLWGAGTPNTLGIAVITNDDVATSVTAATLQTAFRANATHEGVNSGTRLLAIDQGTYVAIFAVANTAAATDTVVTEVVRLTGVADISATTFFGENFDLA